MQTHASRPLAVTAHVAASIVPAVLDVIGQRWSLAIIQALLLEDKSFGQLLRGLHIPRSTLAARLKHLHAMRCLQPASAGYRLTASGQAGWYSVISLHGGGSPEAMKREIWRNYPINDRKELVDRLLNRGALRIQDCSLGRYIYHNLHDPML